MIYDLIRPVDLRWLFDPVLYSSLDDLVLLVLTVLLCAFAAQYCVGDGFEKFAQVLEGFPKYSKEHQNTFGRLKNNK